MELGRLTLREQRRDLPQVLGFLESTRTRHRSKDPARFPRHSTCQPWEARRWQMRFSAPTGSGQLQLTSGIL
jgi:hypothetical protein